MIPILFSPSMLHIFCKFEAFFLSVIKFIYTLTCFYQEKINVYLKFTTV